MPPLGHGKIEEASRELFRPVLAPLGEKICDARAWASDKHALIRVWAARAGD
jgi:hypothetical protein